MADEREGQVEELEVMRVVSEALGRLKDAEAQSRVIRWANDVFKLAPISRGLSDAGKLTAKRDDLISGSPPQESPDLPSLFTAANPASGSEKALVVGYWLQAVKGASDLDAQEINSQLKHL